MPQDKTQNLAESAARELVEQLNNLKPGYPELRFTLITQALRAAEQRGKEAQLMTSEVWGLIQAAEQRGMERAAVKVEELWPKMMAKYVRMPTVNMRVINIVKAIRALAQGGEKV